MRTLVVRQNGRFFLDPPYQAIAAILQDPRAMLWLDITDPDAEDQALLRNQFGFHPLAIEDAIRSHERPKVDAYGVPGDVDGDGVPDIPDIPEVPFSGGPQDEGYRPEGAPVPQYESPPLVEADQAENEAAEIVLLPLESLPPAQAPAREDGWSQESYYFVVFYTAAYNLQEDRIEAHPVSLFIGPNYLVTVHSGAVRHVTETLARWRAPRSPLGNRVGALVHALLDTIVDDYFPLMDQVADRVEELEDTIFIRFDERSIETMFRLKKDLLAMRRIVAPERDVLNVLLRRQLPIFEPEDVAYLQDVYDHIVRVTDNIDTYRDLLSSAVDSYLSLQSNKLNQIMKTLTVASIILMTAALITGFYGQNFKYFPDLDFRLGSFWSLILMAITTVVLVIYFRRKQWL
ncbi:MAG: magnesium/cobalt transporter CorA [Anaerolineae bacterium]